MYTPETLPLHRHPSPHREIARRYKHYTSQKEFRRSVFSSIVFFIASVAVSFFAIQYATERASNSVTDIILSNIPPIDVDGVFVFATVLLIVFIALLLFAHPKRIPFTLHSLAVFFLIRSAFISLTHIGPFPIQAPDANWGSLASHFLFSSDLFFSAHTGAPFLMALVFWREKNLRFIFLGWSVFMGVIVLLGHLHYSIDVVSAYFITYTIFCIAEYLFPKDRTLFLSDVPHEAL